MRDRTFLVLGGAGLVGYQVAYRIATDFEPERIVVVTRTRDSVEQAVHGLRELVPNGTEIVGEWGDVFVREDFSRSDRRTLLEDNWAREAVFEDLMGPIDAAVERSRLAALIDRYRPDVLVDAVNTATAISYQDVFSSAIRAERDMESLMDGDEPSAAELARDVETLILSLSVPQLIRHVLILHKALREAGTRLYLKVGTTGTGGMGLNIPYTHSEDRPSAKLLTKSAVAFAHTGLLWLMARTPDGPIVKEVKPAALIGYGDVAHRTIRERGATVYRYGAKEERISEELQLRQEPERYERATDLQLPVVDTGENGLFTKGEFEVITALRQMEFVTPEEVADLVIDEIAGGNTGREVISALDGSVLGPTYRGGVLRSRVIEQLGSLEVETETHSVALGQLGPPELSKLLWEIELLAIAFGYVPAVLTAKPDQLSRAVSAVLSESPKLRDTIVSLGLPILSADGHSMWRGPFLRIPEVPDGQTIRMTYADRDRWAAKGWIDLRPANMTHWQARLRSMREASPGKAQPGSAGVTALTTLSEQIECGAVVAWVLENELGGWRGK